MFFDGLVLRRLPSLFVVRVVVVFNLCS